jgi:hypothetical protein
LPFGVQHTDIPSIIKTANKINLYLCNVLGFLFFAREKREKKSKSKPSEDLFVFAYFIGSLSNKDKKG